MTEIQMTKTVKLAKICLIKVPKYLVAFVLNFEHLNFGFVSDFVLRISDLMLMNL
jgi:hypothetical protein